LNNIKMKQIVAIVLIFITLFLTGCNPFDNGSTKYLTQKMDEIPLEYDGYELVSAIGTDYLYNIQGQVNYNGQTINVTKGYYIGDNFHPDDYCIETDTKTIYVNNEYMRKKSEVYVQIHNIWVGWRNSTAGIGTSSIMSINVYDNQLFIITNGLHQQLNQYQKISNYPISLYHFDLENETILYAGYYNDFSNALPAIKICKKGENQR